MARDPPRRRSFLLLAAAELRSFTQEAADVCDSGLALSVVYSPVNHVRRDDVGSFSAFEARRSGGSGSILALHLLKGAMFSISRAPKYGS